MRGLTWTPTQYVPEPVETYQQALLINDARIQQEVDRDRDLMRNFKSVTPFGNAATALHNKLLADIKEQSEKISKGDLNAHETLSKIGNLLNDPTINQQFANIYRFTEDARSAMTEYKDSEKEGNLAPEMLDYTMAMDQINSQRADPNEFNPNLFRNIKFHKTINVQDLLVKSLKEMEKSGNVMYTDRDNFTFRIRDEQGRYTSDAIKAATKIIETDQSVKEQIQRNYRYRAYQMNPKDLKSGILSEAVNSFPDYLRGLSAFKDAAKNALNHTKKGGELNVKDREELMSIAFSLGLNPNSLSDAYNQADAQYKEYTALKKEQPEQVANALIGLHSKLFSNSYALAAAMSVSGVVTKDELKHHGNPLLMWNLKKDYIDKFLTPMPVQAIFDTTPNMQIGDSPEIQEEKIKNNEFLSSILSPEEFNKVAKLNSGNAIVNVMNRIALDPMTKMNILATAGQNPFALSGGAKYSVNANDPILKNAALKLGWTTNTNKSPLKYLEDYYRLSQAGHMTSVTSPDLDNSFYTNYIGSNVLSSIVYVDGQPLSDDKKKVALAEELKKTKPQLRYVPNPQSNFEMFATYTRPSDSKTYLIKMPRTVQENFRGISPMYKSLYSPGYKNGTFISVDGEQGELIRADGYNQSTPVIGFGTNNLTYQKGLNEVVLAVAKTIDPNAVSKDGKIVNGNAYLEAAKLINQKSEDFRNNPSTSLLVNGINIGSPLIVSVGNGVNEKSINNLLPHELLQKIKIASMHPIKGFTNKGSMPVDDAAQKILESGINAMTDISRKKEMVQALKILSSTLDENQTTNDN